MIDLAELRRSKTYTMAQVADKTKISESFYSLIENGKRQPSVSVAKRIAAVLGFPWEQFFEE